MGDNERLNAVEPCLWLKKFQPTMGLQHGTPISVGWKSNGQSGIIPSLF